MTLSHLHLLLNHVPTVGAVLALGLLLLAFVRRSAHVTHVGLELLFVIALLTLPVYVTGVAAYRELGDRPELSSGVISDEAIRVHQDVALGGFVVTEFAGFLAWVALWQTRRRGRPARGLVPAVTVLLVVALAVMARAANLGGEIRHPEIRAVLSADTPAPALSGVEGAAPETPGASGGDQGRFVAAEITRIMVFSPWVWPASESVHFLGLALSMGVLLAINFRILGVMPQVAFADVHRLLPWGMLGFGANFITGMLFFVGQPGQYVNSPPFYWKTAFLMVAGANFLYLTVFGNAWAQEQAGGRRFEARLSDKAMAVTSLVAWFGILYAGRMLPFLGDAF